MKIIKNPNYKKWDLFIQNTNQYNIYSTSTYFALFKNEINWYLIEEKNEIIAGILLKKKEQSIAPIHYNGIFIKKKFDDSFKIIQIVDFLIKNLRRENFFFIRTHYNFKDIRSFQWYNYNNQETEKFLIKPFYTGYINLENKTTDQIFNQFNNNRKKIIKKDSKNLDSFISKDYKILDYLSNISNPTRDKGEKYLTTDLAKHSIKKGFGTLLVTQNEKKKPISASLFLNDKHTSYYCVGGYDKKYINLNASSINIFEQIKLAKKKNIKVVDFVGVNSPQRGYFKYTFGAKLKIYFELRLFS